MRVPFKRQKSSKSGVQAEIEQIPEPTIAPAQTQKRPDTSKHRRLSKKQPKIHVKPEVKSIPTSLPVHAGQDDKPTRHRLVSRVAVQWRNSTEKKMGLNKTAPPSKRVSQYEAVLHTGDSDTELDISQPFQDATLAQAESETTRPRDSLVPTVSSLKLDLGRDEPEQTMTTLEPAVIGLSTAEEPGPTITMITDEGHASNEDNSNLANTSSGVDAADTNGEHIEPADPMNIPEDMQYEGDLISTTASSPQLNHQTSSNDMAQDGDFEIPIRTPSPLALCKRSLPRSHNVNFSHPTNSPVGIQSSLPSIRDFAIQQDTAQAGSPCPARSAIFSLTDPDNEMAIDDDDAVEEDECHLVTLPDVDETEMKSEEKEESNEHQHGPEENTTLDAAEKATKNGDDATQNEADFTGIQEEAERGVTDSDCDAAVQVDADVAEEDRGCDSREDCPTPKTIRIVAESDRSISEEDNGGLPQTGLIHKPEEDEHTRSAPLDIPNISPTRLSSREITLNDTLACMDDIFPPSTTPPSSNTPTDIFSASGNFPPPSPWFPEDLPQQTPSPASPVHIHPSDPHLQNSPTLEMKMHNTPRRRIVFNATGRTAPSGAPQAQAYLARSSATVYTSAHSHDSHRHMLPLREPGSICVGESTISPSLSLPQSNNETVEPNDTIDGNGNININYDNDGDDGEDITAEPHIAKHNKNCKSDKETEKMRRDDHRQSESWGQWATKWVGGCARKRK